MKQLSVEIKWALIFFLMTLVWMLLERLVGLHSEHIDKHPVYTNLIAIPAIAVYVFAMKEKRNKIYGGEMTYLQGFKTGIWITLFVTVLSPLTQLIVSYVITPDYFKNAINYAVAVEKVSQGDAERYFSIGNYIMQGLMGAPVMGLVTSAIVALFMKRKKKETEL